MPEYVKKSLHKFKQEMSRKPRYAPHEHVKPVYGVKIQYAEDEDDSEKVDQLGINRIQQIVGTFLYYGIAIDNTILSALSNIAVEQSVTTANTIKKQPNYSTTSPPTQILPSNIIQVAWYCAYIAMLRIYRWLGQEV